MTGPRARRAALLERLDGGSVDLLVVGAGIVGSRVALEAARNGLCVALVDAGDFGGATSSASSKLVHGGLRYLATGDVRLVRRLQAERLALMSTVAPHLVRPLPLLLVVEREHARRGGKLLTALAVYAAISGSRQALPHLVRPARSSSLVPSLDAAAVACCGLVPEAQTHDARLTLATVRAAAGLGATTLNYVRLVAFERSRGAIAGAILRNELDGRELSVRCRAAVNATGPWVDHVRRLADSGSFPLARLSKGVHAVLTLDRPWPAGIALFDESRSALAVPWQGMLLVGATDTEYHGDPERLAVDDVDLAALLTPLARIMSDDAVHPSRIRHSFAGIRVLPRGPGDTASASRRHLIESSPGGLISIAGGKLTTHRTIAVDVLRRLPAELRPRNIEMSDAPLTGADLTGSADLLLRSVEPDVAAHLLGLYGGEARHLLAYAGTVPNALDRIHADAPDVVAQVHFACDEEFALTVDDVVGRRTTLAVRGLTDRSVTRQIADVVLGHDPDPGARTSASPESHIRERRRVHSSA